MLQYKVRQYDNLLYLFRSMGGYHILHAHVYATTYNAQIRSKGYNG